jgi:hypothetical protein
MFEMDIRKLRETL